MAKSKTLFYCTDCGNELLRWQGQCPACGAWNTIVERPAEPKSRTPKSTSGRREGSSLGFNRPRPIGEVETTDEHPIQFAHACLKTELVSGLYLADGAGAVKAQR